jgi:hypothetical protein
MFNPYYRGRVYESCNDLHLRQSVRFPQLNPGLPSLDPPLLRHPLSRFRPLRLPLKGSRANQNVVGASSIVRCSDYVGGIVGQ